MRAIDAEELKRSIAVSALIEDQKTLEQIIDEQPTIEKRKRGEWIKMPYHVTECSECGFSLEDWIQGAFYNYCPNCGADMRGERE